MQKHVQPLMSDYCEILEFSVKRLIEQNSSQISQLNSIAPPGMQAYQSACSDTE